MKKNHNFYFVFIFTACFFISMTAFSNNVLNEKKLVILNKSQVFPKGFENVFLGMSKSQLLGERKIKPLLSIEKNISAKVWVEIDSKSEFYNNIIYSFDETRGELTAVAFGIEADGKYIGNLLPALIQGVINKWGNDYELKSSDIRHSKKHYQAPTLLWRKSDILIAVTYTSKQDAKNSEKAVILIRILKDTPTAYKILSLKNKPDNEILAQFKSGVKEYLRATVEKSSRIFE